MPDREGQVVSSLRQRRRGALWGWGGGRSADPGLVPTLCLTSMEPKHVLSLLWIQVCTLVGLDYVVFLYPQLSQTRILSHLFPGPVVAFTQIVVIVMVREGRLLTFWAQR